jgi:acetyl esterase/lipase
VTSGAVAMFVASARPSALVFRRLLEHSSHATGRSVPRSRAGGPSISDLQYDSRDPDARLDVYFPPSFATGRRLPAVIWIHGGAWISGTKDAAAPYFEMLAQRGITVIAIEYSRAPDARYPTAILQINRAISYVQRNAERLHVDRQQLIIAGDSAGAQMASQIATLVTNPAYAADVGIDPSLKPGQLRGAILFCGAYDAASVARHPRAIPNTAFRLFSRSVLWAYTGSRTRDSDTLRQMSTIDHVTGNFPPTFISGGNADPLTDAHSRPFAARLSELGVDVTTLFYPSDHTPALGHEYQFRIESTDGQAALHTVLGFVQRHTERSR